MARRGGGMRRRAAGAALLAGATLFASGCGGCGGGGRTRMAQGNGQQGAILERVGEFAIAPLEARGFDKLTQRDRILAYYLSRAALAGRDIHYDQLGRDGLEIRDLLEEVLTHPQGLDPEFREALLRYLKRFWICNGNHNERTRTKFVPEFSFDDLRKGIAAAEQHG